MFPQPRASPHKLQFNSDAQLTHHRRTPGPLQTVYRVIWRILEQYVSLLFSTECQCQSLMYFSKEYVMIKRGGTNWDQQQNGEG